MFCHLKRAYSEILHAVLSYNKIGIVGSCVRTPSLFQMLCLRNIQLSWPSAGQFTLHLPPLLSISDPVWMHSDVLRECCIQVSCAHVTLNDLDVWIVLILSLIVCDKKCTEQESYGLKVLGNDGVRAFKVWKINNLAKVFPSLEVWIWISFVKTEIVKSIYFPALRITDLD